MDQTVLQMIVTIICSVLASGGFWAYMQSRGTKNNAQAQMILGLGHDRIVYLGMKYIERGNITKDEYENLKCQFGTSNGSGTENGYGGRRTLPYVFTEQGISMLASVLHSEVAINVSIGIMRAFVEMRRL